MNLLSKNKNKLIVAAIIILALIPSVYFYSQYQVAKNPQNEAKAEVKDLIAKVGKIIELPNEEPTVATVSDKNKLKDQPFFRNAENGDKVLLYAQAKKAILYRPSLNKIIEVAPINIGSAATQPTVQSATPTPGVAKVIILNGTTKVGLTTIAERQLKAKMPVIQIADKDNANKNTYQKTLVSYVSDSQKDAAVQIASILGGEIAPVPLGERNPNSDILIILGKSYIAGESATPVPTVKP